VPTLEETLKLSEEDFKARFGRDKPTINDELVFHCRMGGRAQKGADLAFSLGYKNVKNYKGSYFDWLEKEKSN
jgi:rhodanese-related sulfurtransferase